MNHLLSSNRSCHQKTSSTAANYVRKRIITQLTFLLSVHSGFLPFASVVPICLYLVPRSLRSLNSPEMYQNVSACLGYRNSCSVGPYAISLT